MRRNPLGSLIFFATVLLLADAWLQVTPAGKWARGTFSSIAAKAKTVGPKSGVGSGASVASGAGGALPAARQCRANLSAIENAKANIKRNQPTGSVSWVDVGKLMGLRAGQKPHCPAGGSYMLGSNTSNARCSIGSNGTTATDDDHLLRKSWQ